MARKNLYLSHPPLNTTLSICFFRLILPLIGMLASFSVAAAESPTPETRFPSNAAYICTLNGASRTIAIEYDSQHVTPCTVTYQKDGQKQTLWQAENASSFCEENAKAFIDKQRSWGWQCAADNKIAAE
jgi:hypothetical protein